MPTERTPLLWSNFRKQHDDVGGDVHAQFCSLVGCPPSNAPEGFKFKLSTRSLYGRASHDARTQGGTYLFTAALSNTLLLTQIVLGAALTGLGAAKQDPVIITVFGALNTVIAGLVAYLKSRGQPMRSRMYKDDLERVVDEIENSEVMWLGIARGIHGYSDIDTDGEVTVRSEVARLTRLYDRAVRNNTMNNPDMYMAGGADAGGSGLRSRAQPQTTLPVIAPAPVVDSSAGAAAPVPAPAPATPATPAKDPDQSPASAPPKPKEPASEPPKDAAGETTPADKALGPAPAPGPAPAADDAKAETSKPSADGKEQGKAPAGNTGADPAPAPAPAPTPAPAPAATPEAAPVPGVLEDDEPEPATQMRRAKSSSKPDDKPKKVEGDDE